MTVLDSSEAISEHLRYAISKEDLALRGVRFVLCSPLNEVMAHVHVREDPDDTECDERQVLGDFVRMMADHGLATVMLVALPRPGHPTPTPEDHRWYWATRRACADASIRLIGVHVVTPHGVREVVLDDALGVG